MMATSETLVAELRQAEGIFKEDEAAFCAGDLFGRAAEALSSQSLSLSEAREEIERLKGLVAGIRECPQEPVDVSAWRKAMEGVTPGDWSANGRFISAIGGVDTCEGAVYATIITCDHTYQSDGEGRHWSTTGSAERNAAWIVKCSPPAVAKLLDAYEAARSRAAEWAGSFGSKCGDHQAALRRTEDEREACAQLVENQMPASQDMTSTFICEALERAAAAIRARSVLENSKAPLADATNDPADLSSLRKGAEVAVKPLVWTSASPPSWYAVCPVSRKGYIIDREEGKWWACWNVDLPGFDDLDEAKAAAQSDFETRIRSALVSGSREEQS